MQQPAKYFHKRLNSTNMYASQFLAKQLVKEPFWIRTDDQFAGKGQGAHAWISPPGLNLTGTLVIFPDHLPVQHQFDLSKTFALAAAAFLEIYIDDVRLKWPNDLYVRDHKIGGILIETAIIGSVIDHVVLGIGINVNQLDFSGDIPNPLSISNITGVEYDLTELEDLFLSTFINFYSLMEKEDFERINSLYLDRLYRFNELADFRTHAGQITAKIVGVTGYGHLVLETKSGETESYAYQEIEYVM